LKRIRTLLVSLASRCLFALAVLGALSCQPQIGDECSNASDCSSQEQRSCDTTSPGGYCTILGCNAESCPSEAACIGFQSVVSVAPECADVQSRPRLRRAMCMRTCEKSKDCRSGYVCVDVAQRNPWGAVVLGQGVSGKVCALQPPLEAEGDVASCSATPLMPLTGQVPPPDGGVGDGGAAAP
jgi:hypothetical protein